MGRGGRGMENVISEEKKEKLKKKKERNIKFKMFLRFH